MTDSGALASDSDIFSARVNGSLLGQHWVHFGYFASIFFAIATASPTGFEGSLASLHGQQQKRQIKSYSTICLTVSARERESE